MPHNDCARLNFNTPVKLAQKEFCKMGCKMQGPSKAIFAFCEKLGLNGDLTRPVFALRFRLKTSKRKSYEILAY